MTIKVNEHGFPLSSLKAVLDLEGVGGGDVGELDSSSKRTRSGGVGCPSSSIPPRLLSFSNMISNKK